MSDEEKGEISPEELKAQELLKVQELFASLKQGADFAGAEIQEKLKEITHDYVGDYVALSGKLIPKPTSMREKVDLQVKSMKNERKHK